MGLITWIILGGLAGLIASVVSGNTKASELFLNVILGIFGAIVGGGVAGLVGVTSVGELNMTSLLVAGIGSIVLISVVRAFDKEHV